MSRARRHPGTVRSDVQAFRQISQRFQDEVGGILSQIDFTRGPVPFWSLAIGAVDLVAAEFHIRGTIDDFAVRLEELRLIRGFVMTDIRLRSLGEPQRVFITYPERAK